MSDLLCDAVIASCFCVLSDNHDVHECDCGGQWKGTEPSVDPLRMPFRFVGPPGNQYNSGDLAFGQALVDLAAEHQGRLNNE